MLATARWLALALLIYADDLMRSGSWPAGACVAVVSFAMMFVSVWRDRGHAC